MVIDRSYIVRLPPILTLLVMLFLYLFNVKTYIVYIYILSYIIIALPFIYYLNNEYSDIIHPGISLLILLFLYSVASVIYYNNNGTTIFGDSISESTLTIFIAACILGELGIIIGVIISMRKSNYNIVFNFINNSTCALFGNVMLTLAVLLPFVSFNKVLSNFNFLAASPYSEWALSSRVAIISADSSWPIIQVLTVEMPTILLISASIYLIFRKQILFKIIGFCILTANLLTSFLSGSRGVMFETLCALVLFVHYRVYKWRASVILIGVIVSVILLNGISMVRSTSNPIEMYDILANDKNNNIHDLINLGSSGELQVGLNLMKLIEAVSSGETKLNYGKGFLDDIACYLPRAIFLDRPLPLSEKFVEEFYPGVLDAGGGYGLFFLQDGYWAFGLVGVFISIILFSWAVSCVYLFFKNYFNSDFMVLMYSFVYFPLVVSSPRSGLLLSFKNALMNSMSYVIVIIISYIIMKINRKICKMRF